MSYDSPLTGAWYMGRGTSYAVVYADPPGKWFVEAAPGGDGYRPITEHSTKKKALKEGRKRAKNDKPSQLLIYSKAGEELDRTRYEE